MTPSSRSRFGIRFVLLARQWRRVLDARLADAGLSDATWAPLVHLRTSGDGISQKALAARVGIDGSSLVRLIDILERRGLVERRPDPSDGRARLIFLTDDGRTELSRIRRALEREEAELLADLSDPELDLLLDQFARIARRLEAREAQEETP